MKKTRVIAIICSLSLMLLTIGCSENLIANQDKNTFVPEQTSSLPPVITRNIEVRDGKLVFLSIDELEYTILTLIDMTDQERQSWYEQKGFMSLNDFYNDALDEFSSFATLEQYNSLRNKYSQYFIFNDIDSTDLVPYLKVSKTPYRMVLNKNGEVIIKNSVKNYYDLSSYGDTWQAKYNDKQTRGKDQAINYLKIYDSKRKMWANATMIRANVVIDLHAHVKSFWGWNVYAESYTSRRLGGEGLAQGLKNYFDDGVLGDGVNIATTPRYRGTYSARVGGRSATQLPSGIAFRLHVLKGLAYEFYSTDMGPGEKGVLTIEFPESNYIQQ